MCSVLGMGFAHALQQQYPAGAESGTFVMIGLGQVATTAPVRPVRFAAETEYW
jgi:hypothetical protein